MARKYLNNYVTLLSAPLTDSATTMTVGTAPAALTPGDYYRLQISRVGGGGILIAQEFVDVTAISGNDLTITRAAEGSTAFAWDAGARVELVETAESFTAVGGAGTVTSVGLSAPTGFDVSGSPVTSSGTLTLSYTAGYSLPTDADQSNWTTAFSWGDHAAAGYQAQLVSGTNIKTINGNSLLGSGDLVIAGSAGALNDLTDVTITTPSSGQVLTYNGTGWVNQAVSGTGTVTSVAMTVPTGLTVSGSPITSSGTLAIAFDTGYSIPTNTQQASWVNNSGDTIDDVTLVEFTETTGTLSGTELNITGATIKSRALTANTTFTDGLTDGQSLTLHLTGGDTWVATWPTNTLVGSLPSGGPTAADVWVFWKIGTTLYRRYGGSY